MTIFAGLLCARLAEQLVKVRWHQGIGNVSENGKSGTIAFSVGACAALHIEEAIDGVHQEVSFKRAEEYGEVVAEVFIGRETMNAPCSVWLVSVSS